MANFQPVSVLTSCESLGCTTEKWHKNLHSRLSECITDSFPSNSDFPTSNLWGWVQICWNPKFPMCPRGRGGGRGQVTANFQLPTFDPESKSAKMPNSLCAGGGGGGGGRWWPTFSQFQCWPVVRVCHALQKNDTKIYTPDWVSASQIVSLRKLISLTVLSLFRLRLRTETMRCVHMDFVLVKTLMYCNGCTRKYSEPTLH